MSDVSETAIVAWGYTMADIERLAWAAMRRQSGAFVLDTEERYQNAWHGVVVALFEATSWPHHFDLIGAGMDALSTAAADERRCGIPDATQQGPNFIKYWRVQNGRDSDGFSDHLVEVMSLPAILGTLTPGQYQAIVALAAHDNDNVAAAEALGISIAALKAQVSAARKRARAAWYGDETPPDHRKANTCGSGHDRAKHGQQRPDGVWQCNLCRRNAERRRRAKTRGDLADVAA